MLKLALAKSVVETKMVQTVPLPQGAVFYPTLEQFADPIKYIARCVVIVQVFRLFLFTNVRYNFVFLVLSRRLHVRASARLSPRVGGILLLLLIWRTTASSLTRGSRKSTSCRFVDCNLKRKKIVTVH